MPRFLPRTRGGWVRTIGVLILAVYGCTGGCYAQRLPTQLPADALDSGGGVLPYRVVVLPWEKKAGRPQNAQAYAAATYTWLQGSGAFASVRSNEPMGDADLVATSTGVYSNTAAVPMLTLLSLGIIPTIFTDANCEGVEFRAARNGRDRKVTVSFRQEGQVVMGWLGVPVGFLPGWTHGDVREHRRSREHSRLELLRHRAELEALTTVSAP